MSIQLQLPKTKWRKGNPSGLIWTEVFDSTLHCSEIFSQKKQKRFKLHEAGLIKELSSSLCLLHLRTSWGHCFCSLRATWYWPWSSQWTAPRPGFQNRNQHLRSQPWSSSAVTHRHDTRKWASRITRPKSVNHTLGDIVARVEQIYNIINILQCLLWKRDTPTVFLCFHGTLHSVNRVIR